MRWVLVIVVGLLGAGLGAGAMWWFAGPPEAQAEEEASPDDEGGAPPAAVRVGQVQVQTLRNRLSVTGRLQEVRRVEVTAEVEGRITKLPVEQGDVVRGGGDTPDTLAELDRTWAELELASAEAELAKARAELQQAESDLQQLEALSEAGSARQREVDDQQTLRAARRADVRAAEARRDRAQQELARSVIVAPFDAAVSEKLAEVGQWVSPGDPVVELVSIGQIDAVAEVPERQVARLTLGDEAEVVVGAVGQTLIGKIVSIRPDGMTASRSFPVKVRIEDSEHRLRPGMSVTVRLPVSEEAEHLTVPRDAVLQTPTGAQVWYAMDPSNMGGPPAPAPGSDKPEVEATDRGDPSDSPPPMAMSEPVEVLFGTGDRLVVRPLPGAPFPALNPGTRVIIEGAERLWPTRPLSIQDPAPHAAKQAASPPTP
jgi:RND family efflux transporter MFP subunit